MSRRTRTILAGLAAVAVLALAGAAIAGAAGAFDGDGDGQLAGPQADRARAAAIRVTGGGSAGAVERDAEGGAAYEVEVTRPDGSTVDVRLDRSFRLVVIDGDTEADQGPED